MTDQPGTTSRGVRATISRLRELLDENPDLASDYAQAKRVQRVFRRPAFYEITQRCNLFCEGCYYFEGGRDESVTENRSLAHWDAFFAAQGARGVSMGYFVGAEPALDQNRLLAASRYIPHGVIGTNGTIPIHPEVGFRLKISVWGDEETDTRLRGAGVLRKALRNYAGDPRAMVLFTFNDRNIEQARPLMEQCRDHGLRATFNMYSPTHTYDRKLRDGVPNDDAYFRLSSPGDNLKLTEHALRRIRETVASLIEDFPETVVYSADYNTLVTRPGPIYRIDAETGVATDCGSRIRGNLSYYTSALEPVSVKCCTSDVDCSQCRLYSGGWSSRLEPRAEDLADADSLRRWIGMVKMIGEIFVYDAPDATAQPRPETERTLVHAAGR